MDVHDFLLVPIFLMRPKFAPSMYQVEACPPGGTPLRRKLSSRFVDAMTEFVGSSGDEMAFFKGRQWISRGVRYPTTEEASTETDTETDTDGGEDKTTQDGG